jgi:hypothetical protein
MEKEEIDVLLTQELNTNIENPSAKEKIKEVMC